MIFVNTKTGGLIWPAESVTGGASPDGTLLDTGWTVNWPGPGEVYLKDADLVDILVPALEREAVQTALSKNGWTAPKETNAELATVKAEFATVKAALEGRIAEAEALSKALSKVEPHTPKHKHTSKS